LDRSIEFGKIESSQGFEQRTWIVDRPEPQSRAEILDFATESGKLKTDRMRVRFVTNKKIEDRKEFGLALVARSIGDDGITYFEQRP
jgi:hypothetical protein